MPKSPPITTSPPNADLSKSEFVKSKSESLKPLPQDEIALRKAKLQDLLLKAEVAKEKLEMLKASTDIYLWFKTYAKRARQYRVFSLCAQFMLGCVGMLAIFLMYLLGLFENVTNPWDILPWLSIFTTAGGAFWWIILSMRKNQLMNEVLREEFRRKWYLEILADKGFSEDMCDDKRDKIFQEWVDKGPADYILALHGATSAKASASGVGSILKTATKLIK